MKFNLINLLFLLCSISFSQIQHGGVPKYVINEYDIKIHEVDYSKEKVNELHPMVLRYAYEYLVDIDIISESTKVTLCTSGKILSEKIETLYSPIGNE